MTISIRENLESGEMSEIAVRIMFAGIDLFGRKGYSATSVREIVHQARVTNPMLYYYFDNKEGLFHKTIEYLLSIRIESLTNALGGEAGFEQKLRKVVDFHLDSLCESPEILTFFYAILFGPRESRPDYEIRENADHANRIIGEFFDQAIESGEFQPADDQWGGEELARALIGQISFHLMRSLKELEEATSIEERQEVLDRDTGARAREELIRFYLKGAGTPQG